MKEIGRIITVDDKKGQVVVQFDRKSQCDKCGMCLVSQDSKTVELELKNNLGAKLNDLVEVTMGDSFVLMSAIIVYLIPILLIGLSFAFTWRYGEGVQIIGFVISLVIGIIISFTVDKIIKNHKGYKPEIINIVEKSKEEEEHGR